MTSVQRHATTILAGLVTLLACPESRDGGAQRPSEGFLVWESNRTGSWRIWTRSLDASGRPERLSPEEPGRDHFGAHISPDGTRVAYLSYPKGSDSYHDGPPAELRVLRVADRKEESVARDAHSYGESRSVVWLDGHRLLYLASDRSTQELDLRTGGRTRIATAPEGRAGHLLNATRTHGTSNEPTFSPYDSSTGSFAPAPRQAGCQPYFTRDGRSGFWVAASGGPILRIDLARGRSTTLIDRNDPRLPEGFRYVYFPMVSPGQRLLAWAASGGDHDHFRADYEIFVAPIDPVSLELEGGPVRYTFDPGTDRFPDVFLAGHELGHRIGEVPFPIEFDPAAVGPEHEPGWRWEWDFGDGTRSTGAVGRHVYESAGSFSVVARRGARSLRGRVDVEPPAPPRPLRTVSGTHEAEVTFDEAIEARAVVASLASGAPVKEVAVKPDRRTLLLRTWEPLDALDHLRLEGLRDAAGHTAPALTLVLERQSWPANEDGLVFLFAAGGDARTPDPTGREARRPLVSHGRARVGHHGALVLSGGSFEAQGAGRALARSCARADGIAIEAVVQPRDALQSGSRPILRVDDEGGRPLLELAHRRDQLRWRLRTHEADPKIPVARVESQGPVHLVVSFRSGRLVAYRNGVKTVDTDRVRGDLTRLEDAGLLRLGGDGDEGSGWRGSLDAVAIYCRTLGPEEAAANAHAYRARLAEREAVPGHRVRARLVAASEAPTLEEIAPYRDALVVYEWEVLRVLDGELAEPRVRVAHWAVLGGEPQPVPHGPPGTRSRLELERLSDNEQAAAYPLMDGLEPRPDLPLFLDVGGG